MHCLRRASSRLLSSSFAPNSVVTSRTASASRFQTTPPIIGLSLDPYHSSLQVRWNSSTHDESDHNDIEPESSMEPPGMPKHQGFSKRLLRHKILDNKTHPPSETIYVGNLFYDLTAEQLRSKMEEFGTVARTWIVYDSRGLNKGFGYVQFTAIDGAIRAVKEMHMQVLEGREMVVQFARGHIQTKQLAYPPSNSIFIGDLPFGLTDWELQDLFKGIKGYHDVRFPVDRRSGLPRGYAHADFFTVEQAGEAIKRLQRKRPHGRKLRVNFSQKATVSNATEDDVEALDRKEQEGKLYPTVL